MDSGRTRYIVEQKGCESMKARKARFPFFTGTVVLLAVMAITVHPAVAAKKIMMRYAHGYSMTNPAALAGQAVENYINASPILKDKIKFEHYPGNSLYSTAEARNQIKIGGLEFSGEVSSYLSMNYPEFQLLDLPFLFKSPQHCYDTLAQTAQGKEMFEKIETLGITVICPYRSTSFFYKYWNNKKPIKSIDDFKGLKIRCAPGMAFTDVTELLGASTISMAVPEVVSGFQTGMIDGIMTNENGWNIFRLMDYCNNVTLFNINSSYSWFVVNTQWWKSKVPDELKPELVKAIQTAAEAYEKGSEELRLKVWSEISDLVKQGKFTVTTLSPEEEQRWIDAEKPLYEKLGNKYGWEIINKARELAPNYTATGVDIIERFKN